VHASPQFLATYFPATTFGLILVSDVVAVVPLPSLRRETDPVSETLCFLVFRTAEDGQCPETQQFRVLPSSEPFRV
jgi:hypothetical protein